VGEADNLQGARAGASGDHLPSRQSKTRPQRLHYAEVREIADLFRARDPDQVTLDFLDGRVRAEILVDAEHKHNFVALAEGDDASVTFDGALHKMEQQIRKYKEKVQDHRRDRPLNEMLESGASEGEAE
jgi:putative sigma-54 modulation protein